VPVIVTVRPRVWICVIVGSGYHVYGLPGLVPLLVATVRSVVPVPPTAVTLSFVGERTRRSSATAKPNFTMADASKLEPMIVSVLPPSRGPPLGENRLMLGRTVADTSGPVRPAPIMDSESGMDSEGEVVVVVSTESEVVVVVDPGRDVVVVEPEPEPEVEVVVGGGAVFT
jgi:hypothetical protein